MGKVCIVILTLIWSQKIVKSSSLSSSIIEFKPGECPNAEKPTLCPLEVRHECLVDDECRGDLKCCSVGCDNRCVNPTINKLRRSGSCPEYNREKQCPDLVNNECIVDTDCGEDWICCSDGCILKCIKGEDQTVPSKPNISIIIKPGKCPIFEDPEECPVLVYNDCMLDDECPGTRKCCDTGCSHLCVDDDGTIPSELKERDECPAVKKGHCSGMSHDQCRWDKQCFGGQKCCFDGCIFKCMGELKNTPQEVCHEAVDIGFVIDTSGSVSQGVFNLVKYFLRQIIDRFEVSNQATHFSLITFGTSTDFMLSFKKGSKIVAVREAIEEIPYSRGKSRLDLALIKASKKMFKKHSGMRRNVPKYLIVVSDGKISYTSQSTDVSKVSNKIKNKGVDIFSVGITSDMDMYTMTSIASHERNVLRMSDYSVMMNISKYLISKHICKKAARTSVEARHL